MLFSRRAIQQFLLELQETVSPEQSRDIVRRLNQNNFGSLAAEWEVALLSAFGRLGHVRFEEDLGGRTKCDICFRESSGDIGFVADITAVSDRGLEKQYPTRQLGDLVHEKLKDLGLPGAISYDIRGEIIDAGPRKRRVQLGLPNEAQLRGFLEKDIYPWLRQIKRKGESACSFTTHHLGHALTLQYDRGGRYATGSHLSFTTAYSRTNNALHNAIAAKVRQLRACGFSGPRGIIVCDAGCSLLQQRAVGFGAYSSKEIISAFLRNNTSIAFVATLAVNQPPRGDRTLTGNLFRNGTARSPISEGMAAIIAALPTVLPRPEMSGTNACLRIDEGNYGVGSSYRGGYKMSDRKFTMSARELLNLLSGEEDVASFEAVHGFDRTGSPFKHATREGHLFEKITIINQPARDDEGGIHVFSVPGRGCFAI